MSRFLTMTNALIVINLTVLQMLAHVVYMVKSGTMTYNIMLLLGTAAPFNIFMSLFLLQFKVLFEVWQSRRQRAKVNMEER